MNIEIKSVTSRTEFEATGEGVRLAGTYVKNQADELTELSATAYNASNNIVGSVRGYRRDGAVRYDYSSIADADMDGVRALAVGVVASTEPESEPEAEPEAETEAETEEGGAV